MSHWYCVTLLFACCLQDWKLLYHEGGLRTFMAVPVTGQDGLLGVVGLASKRHGAFMEYWCELLPCGSLA
jgi:hypothetical protein